MYAIIEDGGKQYKVTSGDRLLIDREVDEQTKTVTFDRVLLVGGEGKAKIGLPTVSGASVSADVVGPKAGPKIDIFKYKRRKRYRLRKGHRQHYTEVKVSGITV